MLRDTCPSLPATERRAWDEPTSTFGQLVCKSVDGVCSWNNSDLQASFILAGQKEVRDLYGLRSLANSSTVDASACLRGGKWGLDEITPEQIGRESFEFSLSPADGVLSK
jgi:hypothetical protein